jgi:hypothetical protein
VAVVVLVAIFLPKRPLYALDAYKLDADDRADLAADEAAAMAHPDDGAAAAELAQAMKRAGQLDWAVEAGRDGAARATDPTRWRAEFAESEGLATRGEIREALGVATDARTSCEGAGTACPAYEQLKLDLWVRYLDAGLQSGIDPLKDPNGFREAADGAMNWVDIGPQAPGIPGAGSPSAPP